MDNGKQIRPGRAYESTRNELLAEAGVMALAVAAVYFLHGRGRAMPAAMGAIIALRFLTLNRRGDWIFFLLGVVLGGGNDVLSMYKGVYHYNAATVLPVPIPLWMVVFWGQVFVSFRKLMRFGPFKGPDEQSLPLIDAPLALDIVIAVIYRMIIYRTASTPWLPDALFAAILIIRLLVLPPRLHERRLMLAMIVIGPLYEMLLIGCGLYVYQTGVILGMPLWLIVYWVFIIRALKAIFDRVENVLATAPRKGW
ncbi:MAG TPA: DUF2878 family protein [bacterium]|nr:DUF2878 family protein [bacterium]